MRGVCRLVLLLGLAGTAIPVEAATVAERIAARLATIDQVLYETHRRCEGSRKGVFDLLTRIRPYAAEADVAKLDEMIKTQDPSGSYGRNQAFIEAENLPLDHDKGLKAFHDGRLEFGAQALLPPERQYEYFVQYGRPAPECLDTWLKVDAVRHDIERVRELVKQYPGWEPPPGQL